MNKIAQLTFPGQPAHMAHHNMTQTFLSQENIEGIERGARLPAHSSQAALQDGKFSALT